MVYKVKSIIEFGEKLFLEGDSEPPIPDILEISTIKDLTDNHISIFEARVRLAKSGNRSYRLDECKKYLSIWRSIRSKSYVWELLNNDEKNELRDAHEDAYS